LTAPAWSDLSRVNDGIAVADLLLFSAGLARDMGAERGLFLACAARMWDRWDGRLQDAQLRAFVVQLARAAAQRGRQRADGALPVATPMGRKLEAG